MPAGGVPGSEPQAVVIHAVGHGVQHTGPRHPAQFLGVQGVQPPPYPDGDGALVDPGGLVSVDVVVQGPSDRAPCSAVGSVIWGGASCVDEGHAGACEGGVNDVGGGRSAVGTGSAAPRWFDALAGYTPPTEGLVRGGSGCQKGAGRSPYRAQVYNGYAVPSVSVSNLCVDFRASP